MGKRAGKIELAWLHAKDAAPWGWIVLVLTLTIFLGAALLTETKWGDGGSCGPRGMTISDNC